MTVTCHPDLRRLLEVEMDSPTSFSIQGDRVVADPAQLLQVLESELYYRLYSGSAQPGSVLAEDPAESLGFIATLSEANTGTGTWESGWRVSGAGDGSAIRVIKDGITFWAKPGQVRAVAGSVAPGERCAVRVGKEKRHLLFGFYLALGNEDPGSAGPEPVSLVRIYWHLTPGAAVPYMQATTRRLNEAGIPFQTKVVSNPRHYGRRDSGVLYLRRANFALAAPALGEVYRTVKTGLLPEVPLFTKPLAPGVGLAEDPGGGMSFGQSRCHTAALGLLECQRQGLTEPDARLAAIAETFRAEGLDPAYPHLAPGSTDSYEADLDSAAGG